MAKIEKVEKFLKEEKPKKEKDLEVGFDIESFEKEEDTDTLGFRSEFEPIAKGKEKTLKKEIQVTTPGLKKSIKKFEDFQISVSIDKIEPEEDVFDPSKIVMGAVNPSEETSDLETCSDCECSPCGCGAEDCCSNCECDPCECASDDTEKVVRFEDFLKSIL
jgi:hypothetical protein